MKIGYIRMNPDKIRLLQQIDRLPDLPRQVLAFVEFLLWQQNPSPADHAWLNTQGKRKKTIEKLCYVARPAARTVSIQSGLIEARFAFCLRLRFFEVS